MFRVLPCGVSVGLIGVALLVPAAFAARKGPVVDTLVFDSRMSQEIGVQDAAAGNTDLFYYGLSGVEFAGLTQGLADELKAYSAPIEQWSLEFNPYPNAAPYIATASGVDYFNPFAIAQVRFAMNYLVDRQNIVDNILNGGGGAEATPMTPGQPGTFQYNVIPMKLGIAGDGDKAKGVQMITDALAAAAKDSKGRLVAPTAPGGFWQFDGKAVTVTFLIPKDDPNVRLKVCNYVADLIEEAGISVDRKLTDSSPALNTTYTDPKAYLWNIYAERWGMGGTRKWWEASVWQFYAGWFGQMPGRNTPAFWQYSESNYASARINALTQDVHQGRYVDVNDYSAKLLEATELGVKDSVRVFLAYGNQYFVANKARFKAPFVYGLADGPDRWSMITASVPAVGGTETLNVTLISRPAFYLFDGAWDPIGTGGFRDSGPQNSTLLVDQCTDPGTSTAPGTGDLFPLRVESVSKVQRGIDPDTKEGTVAVPFVALEWDHATHRWAGVGPGVKAKMAATYSFTFGKWHDGTPIALIDYIYAVGFKSEWSHRDGVNDLRYDGQYASIMNERIHGIKGYYFDFAGGVGPDSKGTITVYYDYSFPADPDREDYYGAPELFVSASGANVGVSWPIEEALARLVTVGGASGTAWELTSWDKAITDSCVDVLRPSCVADIREALVKMRDEQYVPDYIEDYTTPQACVAAYQNAIDWIDVHGHAYISNGPFFIDIFDPANQHMVEKAFRDANYPFEAWFWNDVLQTRVLSIREVVVPVLAEAGGDDFSFLIKVDQAIYPDNNWKPATEATVTLRLEGSTEIRYKASLYKPGYFDGEILGRDTAGLPDGHYPLVATAQWSGALPSALLTFLVIQTPP